MEKGDECRITGERGIYVFVYERNGEITLYGGQRAGSTWVKAGYRTVTADQIAKKK